LISTPCIKNLCRAHSKKLPTTSAAPKEDSRIRIGLMNVPWSMACRNEERSGGNKLPPGTIRGRREHAWVDAGGEEYTLRLDGSDVSASRDGLVPGCV
jgi:hypothetical protein